MDYDLESPLENRLNWLSFLFLGTGVAMGSLAFEVHVTGNQGLLFVSAGLPLAVGILFLYLRSTFEDRLLVEGDQLVTVRKKGEQSRELGRVAKSSVLEASMNQPSEHRKTTSLVLLLQSGQLLEINFPERSQAEAMLADLGVTPRADLSDDVSVTRRQGQPTLRAKTKLDWFGRLFFGLIFLSGYLVLTLKILSIK